MSATRHQSGLSLVELLVAMTILAIATTIALVIYDGARQAFHIGENVSEQQQAVRIAHDLVASDIRHAGFNANPDGNKERPDESIEGAFDRAIVIRADFDNEDPVDSHAPEDSLAGAGSAFLAVSTGNDEIRAYVLAKPDGSSTDTLTFQADVGQAVRDGTVETVTIPNVALTHNDPPYTLYRVTLANDASPQRTVLIENVRSMSFEYFDRAADPLAAPGGLDNLTGLAARAEIHRVGLSIEALTRDPDLTWRDRNDGDPDTWAYRKFALAGDVTPRNLGLMGIKDFQADSVPPAAPVAPQLFPGHCGGLYIGWPPNPPDDEVAYYTVRFGTSPGSLTGQRAVDDTEIYIGGLLDAQQYYVAVQAVDGSGNQSSQGPASDMVTANSNTPETPLSLNATEGEDREVELEWNAVSDNTTGTPGDPKSPLLRELAGYRLYRDDSSGFTPSSSKRIVDESELLAAPDPIYDDERIVNCRQYFYRVTAVDQCGLEGGASGEASGRSISNVEPVAPANVQAFYHVPGTRRVLWDEVTRDVNDDRVYIEDHEVWRTDPVDDGLPPPPADQFKPLNPLPDPGTREYIDQNVAVGNDQAVWYAVKAKDDCPNFSELSAPYKSVCWFSGTGSITDPNPGSKVWSNTQVTVKVIDGIGLYSEVRLFIENDATGETISKTFTGGASPWIYWWNAKPPDSDKGFYTIRAEIDQDNLGQICTRTTEIHVEVDNN